MGVTAIDRLNYFQPGSICFFVTLGRGWFEDVGCVDVREGKAYDMKCVYIYPPSYAEPRNVQKAFNVDESLHITFVAVDDGGVRGL